MLTVVLQPSLPDGISDLTKTNEESAKVLDMQAYDKDSARTAKEAMYNLCLAKTIGIDLRHHLFYRLCFLVFWVPRGRCFDHLTGLSSSKNSRSNMVGWMCHSIQPFFVPDIA